MSFATGVDEQRLAAGVLVIGTGAAGLRAAIELARAGRSGALRRQTAPRRCAHRARRGRRQRGARNDGSRGQLGAARGRHVARVVLARRPGCRRASLPRGARCDRRLGALRRTTRAGRRRPADAALLRRPPVPPHVLRGGLHGQGDPASARAAGERTRRRDPRRPLRDAPPRPRRTGVRRVRLRPRRRDAMLRRGGRGRPGRGRPYADLATLVVETRREHR